MDKFTLIIRDSSFPPEFDLVIGPADIEKLEYHRRAWGNEAFQMRAILLQGRAIDVHIAKAEVTLPLVEVGPALMTDLKQGMGIVRLYPMEVRARATEEKPGMTAVGHVYLHWPEIGGQDLKAHEEQIEQTSETAVGNIRLYLLTINGRARHRAPFAPPDDEEEEIRLYPCAMTGRDLISRFRELSQDEVEPYLWGDSFILNMLNDAEREAADRAKLLYDDSPAVAVTVTAGTARYAIDRRIIDIERAALTAEGDHRPPLHLKIFDRMELDWKMPPRSRHEAGLPWGRPFGLVYDGKQEVEIVPTPQRNGLLLLGVHRWPWTTFDLDDEPEIPCIHHRELVSWALYRAFSIPDADEANERLAAYYLDSFEKYFGRRIDAKKRRTQRMNKPHINKLW